MRTSCEHIERDASGDGPCPAWSAPRREGLRGRVLRSTWGAAAAVGAALTILGVGAPRAHAARSERVLLLQGVHEGIAAQDSEALAQALEQALQQRPGSSVLPRPEGSLIDLMFEADCVEPDPPCLASIGRSHGATTVVFFEVERADGKLVLWLRQVRVADAQVTAERRAPVASAHALAAEVPRLAERLWGPLPAPKEPTPPARVTLRVRSEPAGATVTVDGTPRGRTPLQVEVAPGEHVVRFELAGHVAVERKVQTAARPVELVVRLERRAAPAPAPLARVEAPPWYRTWWFWTAVGVGVAGAAVGVAAAAGAFDTGGTPVGDVTFTLGTGADQDAAVQALRGAP